MFGTQLGTTWNLNSHDGSMGLVLYIYLLLVVKFTVS